MATRSAQRDTRTITHRGRELQHNGMEFVERLQNQPDVLSSVLEFTCPEKFRQMTWVGRRHPVRFVPRTAESFTGSTNDDTVVQVDSDLIPIAGEYDLEDQRYPVIEAFNVTQSTRIDVANVDYAGNQVTLASDPADGDDVRLFPILSEGGLVFKGFDQFGNQVGVTERWKTPLETWHSLDQLDPDTKVHLGGEAQFTEAETFAVQVDSPYQIVWEDPVYPDSYVSSLTVPMDVVV
jgi:hypothetical protein